MSALSEGHAMLALMGLRLRLPVALALWPLDRVVAHAASGPRVRIDDAGLPASFARVERWLSGVRVVPDTCLYRALSRWAVLRRSGRRVRFVMGVREDGAELAGHAWVEEHGAALGEELDAAYVVTYAYPASEAPASEA